MTPAKALILFRRPIRSSAGKGLTKSEKLTFQNSVESSKFAFLRRFRGVLRALRQKLWPGIGFAGDWLYVLREEKQRKPGLFSLPRSRGKAIYMDLVVT